MKYKDTIIVIPARFGSTRLPGKALADINGKPMVVRVMDIAKTSGLCDKRSREGMASGSTTQNFKIVLSRRETLTLRAYPTNINTFTHTAGG